MILKEAYRYQNFLSGMLNNVTYYLKDARNTTIVTSEHMRSKAHPEATDETTSSVTERTIQRSVHEVLAFGLAILREKERLAAAIDDEKMLSAPSVDREISLNRSRYAMISTLKTMMGIKPRERVSYGTAFCFNAEGVQTPYRYDIKETVALDFDRKEIRSLINELSRKADEASNKADYCLNSVNIDFTPTFSIDDSFEDALDEYCEANPVGALE